MYLVHMYMYLHAESNSFKNGRVISQSCTCLELHARRVREMGHCGVLEQVSASCK